MKAVIVLGSRIIIDAHTGQYVPGKTLLERLETAYQFLADNGDDKTIIIVSGGVLPNKCISEATIMKSFLVKLGISSNRIFEENRSHNTIENCIFSFELMDELIRKRVSFQELHPNYLCNYYGSCRYGEIPPITEAVVISSDFHIPRVKVIFNHFNRNRIRLMFLGSISRSEEAQTYIQKEKAINPYKCISIYEGR